MTSKNFTLATKEKIFLKNFISKSVQNGYWEPKEQKKIWNFFSWKKLWQKSDHGVIPPTWFSDVKILSTAKIAKFFENLGVFSNLLSNNLDEIKNCQFYDYLLPI